jgi:hypothetical protein
LPRSTKYFPDLHHRIQDFVLTYLEKFVDPSSLNLGSPIPKVINDARVMTSLVLALRQELADGDWPIDPAKFRLGGPQLYAAMQSTPPDPPQLLSYLVQYIFERVRAAHP